MTSAVFDFPDIRSRMLGDDKPQPKPKTSAITCGYCEDKGWLPIYFSSGANNFVQCGYCNPLGIKPCP